MTGSVSQKLKKLPRSDSVLWTSIVPIRSTNYAVGTLWAQLQRTDRKEACVCSEVLPANSWLFSLFESFVSLDEDRAKSNSAQDANMSLKTIVASLSQTNPASNATGTSLDQSITPRDLTLADKLSPSSLARQLTYKE
jgi:hypothetical protein